MKNKKNLYIIFVISILILFGCKREELEIKTDFTIETVTRSLNNQDVYFIFTNTSMTSNSFVAPSVSSSLAQSRSADNSAVYLPSYIDSENEISGIMSEVINFNENVLKPRDDLSRSAAVPVPPNFAFSPSTDAEGNTGIFYSGLDAPSDPNDPNDPYYSNKIDATCKKIITENGVQLSVWVADSDWSDVSVSGKIDQAMVDALANKFILTGVDNDIYEWVTALYGVPWGNDPNNFTNLIDSGEAAYITILLYDIDNDASTNGGTVGYFWSKDNFLSSSYSGSNERIMFYMDSILYATEEDATWETTDYWPETIFSTLGHEFQHMIHFYQKQILFNVYGTDTWLNEMCSEVTEDLIASKLGVAGPRGLNGDLTEGTPFIINSRINDFNLGNNESFLEWSGSIYDYSAAYAFGAFLARNYGGAALFQNIVQSAGTDEFALVHAINALNGTNKTFEGLLIEWGIAVLHSELTNTTYQYNNGGAFQSSPSDPAGTGYDLGSINLNNYGTQMNASWFLEGPIIYNYNISNSISDATLQPATNTYYQAGDNLTGSYTWTVEVPTGVTLTVVVK